MWAFLAWTLKPTRRKQLPRRGRLRNRCHHWHRRILQRRCEILRLAQHLIEIGPRTFSAVLIGRQAQRFRRRGFQFLGILGHTHRQVPSRPDRAPLVAAPCDELAGILPDSNAQDVQPVIDKKPGSVRISHSHDCLTLRQSNVVGIRRTVPRFVGSCAYELRRRTVHRDRLQGKYTLGDSLLPACHVQP
jgi:hypothetical protein